MAAHTQIYKYSNPTVGWVLCSNNGWKYNTTTTAKVTLEVRAGFSTPCGVGYYGQYGKALVYDGGWNGGSVWSGYHYLPAS